NPRPSAALSGGSDCSVVEIDNGCPMPNPIPNKNDSIPSHNSCGDNGIRIKNKPEVTIDNKMTFVRPNHSISCSINQRTKMPARALIATMMAMLALLNPNYNASSGKYAVNISFPSKTNELLKNALLTFFIFKR